MYTEYKDLPGEYKLVRWDSVLRVLWGDLLERQFEERQKITMFWNIVFETINVSNLKYCMFWNNVLHNNNIVFYIYSVQRV